MLEFEEEIYWRFFILTKKRYMYWKCYRDGVVDKKIGKKGVLLARRDNSSFIRNIYERVIEKVFESENRDDVIYFVLKTIQNMCSNMLNQKEFRVTKAAGSTDGMSIVPFVNEKGIEKAKVGNYTVPLLSKDPKKREHQFALKKVLRDCTCSGRHRCSACLQYYTRCLPAVVQLAEKMKRRGQIVDAGSRLEYIILDNGIKNAKQYEKIESAKYYADHRDVLKIDFMYYLKLLSNPLDQLLNVAYGAGAEVKNNKYPYKKDLVLEQFKFRSKTRAKVLEDIRDISAPTLTFSDD